MLNKFVPYIFVLTILSTIHAAKSNQEATDELTAQMETLKIVQKNLARMGGFGGPLEMPQHQNLTHPQLQAIPSTSVPEDYHSDDYDDDEDDQTEINGNKEKLKKLMFQSNTSYTPDEFETDKKKKEKKLPQNTEKIKQEVQKIILCLEKLAQKNQSVFAILAKSIMQGDAVPYCKAIQKKQKKIEILPQVVIESTFRTAKLSILDKQGQGRIVNTLVIAVAKKVIKENKGTFKVIKSKAKALLKSKDIAKDLGLDLDDSYDNNLFDSEEEY